MSSIDSPRTSIGPPSMFPLNLGSRRGSLASLTGSVDKEQLSQALDKIHNTACQSDTLTTFNEFAPPPQSSTENHGIAGDIMQNGLSGLYSRFKGAVGVGKEKPASNKGDGDSIDTESIQSLDTPTSKRNTATSREDSSVAISPAQPTTSSSRLQSPTTSSFASISTESQSQGAKSSKASNPTIRPPNTSIAKATVSSATVPTVTPVIVNAFKDGDKARATNVDSKTADKGSMKAETLPFGPKSVVQPLEDSDSDEPGTGATSISKSIKLLDSTGVDGSVDSRKRTAAVVKSATSALSSIQASDPTNVGTSSRLGPLEGLRKPTAIERITQSHLPGYQASRASSTDRSTAEASPINTSAHNSVRHETFSPDESLPSGQSGRRIPGTTTNEGAPEVVSARLEKMRKQVLSKEFWMADEICKDCFLCGDSFSVIRRKHHCRTCGCIFDSKCTSIISGQRFGVPGSLRVCKTCLDVINNRHDSSGSDASDDTSLPTFFQSQQAKFDSAKKGETVDASVQGQIFEMPSGENKYGTLATPMMTIPATRRVGDSGNRHSLVLMTDDVPQLVRPGSSRSLKSLPIAGRPASSGHKRHQSKHNFLGRFKPTVEEKAPFHREVADDLGKRSKLPQFHDDNIIDPELAPYMSDEESSADEQPSIFATMNSGSVNSASFEQDRSGFGSLLSASKRYRARTGEKSVSGISFTSRGIDETNGSASMGGFARPSRRRNLSAASNNLHLSRTIPRQAIPGFGNLNEGVTSSDNSTAPTSIRPSRMTRSASIIVDGKDPPIEMNDASLHHVRRLLHQLLEDAQIPHLASWEKALVPILLQCTDDVNPNVRHGDDIDIRHYVKLKRIPGGRPGDTTYVSGVVFTKNLALKSMPRTISNPRIVVVSFPIEYQRHQNHFMSLEPVIAQEKDFLRNMVNRIASLRPQLLLVQKHVSGLALQYLAEANIAVVCNVKQSVIEAVSRCVNTEIISSIDMVALKPVHVGKSAAFEVKTFVHNDIPGKKKTYIFLSGCPKALGCTIALRGANVAVLAKIKRITEFMVYVVYNLKLETCLMRDELVLIPSTSNSSGSKSPNKLKASQTMHSSLPEPNIPQDIVAAASDKLQFVDQTEKQAQQLDETKNTNQDGTDPNSINPHSADVNNGSPEQIVVAEAPMVTPKLISAHESHAHGSHEDQLPEDIPLPTFYSDMVDKHQTKILSASPFVKFVQPYLLMRARELERRLVYLRRLRDQDTFEDQPEDEKFRPERFQLIKPEMVHEAVKRAPRQIMEVLHAVHDAEYDKAMHNYLTQKRQWENHVSINSHLFDPYERQNITVLYSVVCTATTVPCSGPELLALAFYNEHEGSREFDPDCTLGQYVEDLCLSINTICISNGCGRKMSEHHRTYVHGEAQMTVVVEKSPCKIKGSKDTILMWSYCKICKKDTPPLPMSDGTWKYSFAKYLELSFWSSELRVRSGSCSHDLHKDHLRYFGFQNVAVRIHYDPIDLLEIIVPRARITWKVDNDLKLKNELFTRFEDRWNRFMVSVKSRIQGMNIDSVAPEKVEACKAEVERLTKLAQEEHISLIRKLQQKYMESKYYEIIPLNRALRAMQEKVAEWDDAFAKLDSNYFPSEKDIRRLATLQLKKMFMDRDESTTSVVTTEGAEMTSDIDEKSPSTSLELTRNPSYISAKDAHDVMNSVVENDSTANAADLPPVNGDSPQLPLRSTSSNSRDLDQEGMEHLDLAVPHRSDQDQNTSETPALSDPSILMNPLSSEDTLVEAQESAAHGQSLSEKIERLRRENQQNPSEQSIGQTESTGIPRPADRGGSRRGGLATSPPLNRTQSQPAGSLRRVKPQALKSFSIKQTETKTSNEPPPTNDPLKTSATEPAKPTDKKLSERLGLGTLKSRKAGHSLIPRSVTGKRKESKVSTLAKHFEQLSREFEKERLKDRKQRAAKITQSRAFPKASSKPIVEVYKDVNEAVEERGPSGASVQAAQLSHPSTSVIEGLAGLNTESSNFDAEPPSSTSVACAADETATEAEAETDDNRHNVSQTASDDDGGVSDADHSLLDDIPDVTGLPESLQKPDNDLPLEIPKHEKSSLMKMLSNFWAERSASGWTPLDYPINVSDHIFADIDVIIREDEPSSLIAFALESQSYRERLANLRGREPRLQKEDGSTSELSESLHDLCEDGVDQEEIEQSLLRSKGTHVSLSFADGSATMQCKIFYAEQFDAVRRKCGVADRIVESLSRCLKWDSKGGKTKSVFLKTLDDRLILKSLSSIETQAFLKFAPAYFNIMAESLFHDLPSVIAKMLGFYQILIKNPATGCEIKLDVLVMENLFYDRVPNRVFDLKGSMRNRKIQSTGEQNEVLLDENMVEFIYNSPLYTREVSHISGRHGLPLTPTSTRRSFCVLEYSTTHYSFSEMMSWTIL
jgi:1-phosphatidylinositol-3-phosphate 5-kinase